MADTFFCSRCGAPNAASATVCQACGASLVPNMVPPPPVAAAAPVIPAYPAAYAAPQAVAGLQPHYGGFWIRVLAYIIDQVLLGILFIPIALAVMLPYITAMLRGDLDVETPPFGFLLWIPVFFAAYWLYDALLTSSVWQGSVGKRICGLKVTDEQGNRIGFGRATGRFFARVLSRMCLWIGFIMVAFMERKRGLHDILAGTLVMYRDQS